MYPSKKHMFPSTGWAGCLQSRCNYIFLQSLYAYRKVTVLDRDGLEEVLNNLE